MAGPLHGIKIIDLSAVISAPLGTMMLADQGADVIKIEPPGRGDATRTSPFRRGGLSAFFANANRGKRSVVLDLSKARGRELLHAMIADADVFVENFRPGVLERLGFGWDALHAANPRLIYCTVSGFGTTGPYSDRRVYDPIIQGLTGYVAIQKNPEVPIRDLVRNIVADKSTAYTVAEAIAVALFARERGAGGQYLQIPMIDAALAFFWPDGMMAHTMVGDGAKPLGPTLYDVFRLTETADGQFVYFVSSDSEWHGLFRALGHPERCEDERYATHGARMRNFAELGQWLDSEFRRHTTSDILKRLNEAEVPAGPVLELDEVLADPQIQHNQAILERVHPTAGRMREVRPAARFSGTPLETVRQAPRHGEHTDEVLAEMGYDDAARAALRAEGAIV